MLTATGDIVAAAIAFDAADDAFTAGANDAASAARARTRAAQLKAQVALRELPARLSAYQQALNSLAAAQKAATSLNGDQRKALDAVVRGGRAEARASDTFRVAAQTAWPAYQRLDEAQSLWLDRRRAGRYRNVEEAAASYTAMTRAGRPELERARTLLVRVDTARRPVSERVRTALAAADEALAPLRSPS